MKEKINGVIYCIENKINGKKYIGQTIQGFEKRINEHKRYSLSSRSKFDSSPKLYRAIRKYGWDNFKKYILYITKSLNILNKKEIEFIKIFNTIDNGYNLTEGGENTKISDYTKKQHSKSSRIIPDKIIFRIFKLNNLGKTNKQISEITKISQSSVSKILLKNNIYMKGIKYRSLFNKYNNNTDKIKKRKSLLRNKLLEKEMKDMILEYINTKIGVYGLSKKYNISETEIGRILHGKTYLSKYVIKKNNLLIKIKDSLFKKKKKKS